MCLIARRQRLMARADWLSVLMQVGLGVDDVETLDGQAPMCSDPTHALPCHVLSLSQSTHNRLTHVTH